MSLVHLAILALSLSGFAALAIGTQRYAPQLVGFTPAPSVRKACWWLGWTLLLAAFALAFLRLETAGIGATLWFGWLSLAGIVLVFALPDWPWRQRAKASPARVARVKANPADAGPVSKPRRWIAWSLLGVTFGVFAIAFLRVETKPIQREDILTGTVGPWSYSFVETNRDPPEVEDMDVPLKGYTLRFCETCDLEISRATLKVNKPRSMRASGMAFGGNRWDRSVEIQLPANLTGTSELWLTVVGKDGSVHQTHWPMKTVSPSTVAWSEQQRKTP